MSDARNDGFLGSLGSWDRLSARAGLEGADLYGIALEAYGTQSKLALGRGRVET